MITKRKATIMHPFQKCETSEFGPYSASHPKTENILCGTLCPLDCKTVTTTPSMSTKLYSGSRLIVLKHQNDWSTRAKVITQKLLSANGRRQRHTHNIIRPEIILLL